MKASEVIHGRAKETRGVGADKKGEIGSNAEILMEAYELGKTFHKYTTGQWKRHSIL